MITRQGTHGAGFGVSFIISTVIHLAVFLLVLWWGRLFAPTTAVQETYYVDVVNLPVASPRAGSPTQKGNGAEAPSPPPAPEPPPSMPSPQQPRGRAATTSKAEKRDTSDAAAFAERMAKLESKAASQQEEAALEQLRKKLKAAGSGRAGMPAGKGSEAGSDYAAYVQSRLKDAFIQTIAYSSKNPEVKVRLYIDTNGKVIRQRIEESSGDHAFELAVLRAIEKASDKLVPPPNHKVFEYGFDFKPQGISRNKP